MIDDITILDIPHTKKTTNLPKDIHTNTETHSTIKKVLVNYLHKRFPCGALRWRRRSLGDISY